MRSPWPEKLGFRLHLLAWRLIRWSIKRRMRRLGYDLSRLQGEWEPIDLVDYRNNVCMECCEEDLAVTRKLLVEEHLARRARRQPALVHAWLARDQERMHALVADALELGREAVSMAWWARQRIADTQSGRPAQDGEDPRSITPNTMDTG